MRSRSPKPFSPDRRGEFGPKLLILPTFGSGVPIAWAEAATQVTDKAEFTEPFAERPFPHWRLFDVPEIGHPLPAPSPSGCSPRMGGRSAARRKKDTISFVHR